MVNDRSPEQNPASDAEVTDIVTDDNARSTTKVGTIPAPAHHADDRWEIEEGTDVIGTCGHKIGEVMDIEGDFVIVEKGFFAPCDLYVPRSAIAGHDKHGIHLKMSKHDIDEAGWDCEPSADRDGANPV
jgi:hypothetical protein